MSTPFGQPGPSPFGQAPTSNATSLFGQTGALAPSGLFANGLGTIPAASGAPSNPFTLTSQPSTGLFGQSAAPSGGLFGTTTSQPAQQTFFGQAATAATSQPPQSLFGQALTAGQPSSLFQPQTGAVGSSLFSTTQKPPMQPAAGELFATTAAATAPIQPYVCGGKIGWGA